MKFRDSAHGLHRTQDSLLLQQIRQNDSSFKWNPVKTGCPNAAVLLEMKGGLLFQSLLLLPETLRVSERPRRA